MNTYPWFRERVYKVEDTGYDPTDFHAAMDKALEWDERIPIGLVYRNPAPRPSIDALDPALQDEALVRQGYSIAPDTRQDLIHEFM